MTEAGAALPDEMPAGLLEAPHAPTFTTMATPDPGPGEVLIEVRRAGVCGTDLHILHGSYGLARFPLVPGHEVAGTIAAIGPGVRRRRVGERVTTDPNLACLTCVECQRGAFNHCLDLDVLGVTRDGGFAGYLLAPERAVYPIGSLSFAQGALVEPLACVAWGLQRIDVQVGDRALVFGAGPMGCMLAQAVRAAGASRVAIVDPVPERLALARQLGVDVAVTPEEAGPRELAPEGFELVADTTGIPAVLESAPSWARSAGTIWVFGVAEEPARVRISPFEMFRRDLRMVGSFALNRTVPEAIALIESGAVRVEPLVSHVLPLSDFTDGLTVAQHDPSRMKVQFAVSDEV